MSANLKVPSTFPAYKYELFTANPTPGESHTLEITATSGNTFYFDYVLMKSDSAFISSPSSDRDDENSGGGNSEKAGEGHHTRADVIIGASVGGLVLLSLFVAVLLFLRRKRRLNKGRVRGEGHSMVDSEVIYTPFEQSPGEMEGMLTGTYQRRRSGSGGSMLSSGLH